jgi:hypothetical protein
MPMVAMGKKQDTQPQGTGQGNPEISQAAPFLIISHPQTWPSARLRD